MKSLKPKLCNINKSHRLPSHLRIYFIYTITQIFYKYLIILTCSEKSNIIDHRYINNWNLTGRLYNNRINLHLPNSNHCSKKDLDFHKIIIHINDTTIDKFLVCSFLKSVKNLQIFHWKLL